MTLIFLLLNRDRDDCFKKDVLKKPRWTHFVFGFTNCTSFTFRLKSFFVLFFISEIGINLLLFSFYEVSLRYFLLVSISKGNPIAWQTIKNRTKKTTFLFLRKFRVVSRACSVALDLCIWKLYIKGVPKCCCCHVYDNYETKSYSAEVSTFTLDLCRVDAQ